MTGKQREEKGMSTWVCGHLWGTCTRTKPDGTYLCHVCNVKLKDRRERHVHACHACPATL